MIMECLRSHRSKKKRGEVNRICHSRGIITMTIFLFTESIHPTTSLKLWNTPGVDNERHNHHSYPITTSSTPQSSQQQNIFLPYLSYSNFMNPHATPTTGSSTSGEECPTYSNESKNCCHNDDDIAPAPIIKKIFSMKKTDNGKQLSQEELLCQRCRDPKTMKICQNMPRGGHGGLVTEIISDTLTKVSTSTTTTTTPYNIPLNIWKILFQTILTSLNILCWYIPLKSKHITNNEAALSYANAFSGGVFLSLAFGHFIPECIHGFGTDINEATPYMFVLFGYLLIFFVEKVAFDAHDILHEMQHQGDHNDAVALSANGHHHDSHGHSTKSVSTVAATTATTPNGIINTITSNSSGGRGTNSAVLLLGALAVHSILEMMALGLSDTFHDSALLTFSISLHQPAESIALLIAFMKSGMTPDLIIKYLSIFSCMGPIGVLVGMIVKQYASPVIDSMMIAIVAGTFIYVGATEVIPEEWEDSKNKWKKFIALMSGIVSIYAITQYTMTLEAH